MCSCKLTQLLGTQARQADWSFSQKDMPYFRKRIIAEVRTRIRRMRSPRARLTTVTCARRCGSSSLNDVQRCFLRLKRAPTTSCDKHSPITSHSLLLARTVAARVACAVVARTSH